MRLCLVPKLDIEYVHTQNLRFLIKSKHRILNPITHRKLSKNICIFAKNRHLFGLDIGKISICGDKMVT